MTKIDRSIPPEIKPIETFALPAPKKSILKNNIESFYFYNPNIDLIYIMLQVETGLLYQERKHVCQFSYMLLRESSADFEPQEIDEKLDYYGTNFSVNVGLDKVKIAISVPKRNVEAVLPLICDFLVAPKFREKSLKLYKEKEIKNLAYNLRKTDYLSWRNMWNVLFSPTFPEAFQLATNETIEAVTTEQLAEFYKKSFVAENVSIFITGNFDEKVERLVENQFSRIPAGATSSKISNFDEHGYEGKLFYTPFEGTLQSSVVLAVMLMGYNHEDRRKFSVLNTVAGGYFGSRLMQNLRERNGYTYGVFSSQSFFADKSIFAISCDVNADDTEAAVAQCFSELQLLTQEPVDTQELERVKSYMLGMQLRSVDTSVNVMTTFANYRHFGLDETEFERYISDIKNITSDEILNLAKKYFDSNKIGRFIVGKYCEKKY